MVSLLFLFSSVHADEKRYVVPIEDSPALGPADAPVTIIEFLDFQ
jgi:protein-disulfide isomerase